MYGTVPQGQPKANYLQGLSVIGVQQIDRVVEVVEETLKGTKPNYNFFAKSVLIIFMIFLCRSFCSTVGDEKGCRKEKTGWRFSSVA